MVKKNAGEVFEIIKNSDNIIGKQGKIQFNLLNIAVDVNTKDIVGSVLQTWFEQWLIDKEIDYSTRLNTQEWPDFFLDSNPNKTDLLEVKTFDFDRSPNFDVANFDAYTRSLTTEAYRLDADYLIFGYQMSDEGTVKIRDIWLKKIWEICGSSDRFPLKTQVKQDVIVNIRPVTWYSYRCRFRHFRSRNEFVNAIHQTLQQYPMRAATADDWLRAVSSNYEFHTGHTLS